MKKSIAVTILVALTISCDQHAPRKHSPVQKITGENIGETVTVEGWAVNRSLGAVLVGDDFSLWIDGLRGWPDGHITGGGRGKKVRVTGILDEDYGLPVFIEKDGEPPRHGIPVSDGTDLEEASHRFILRHAHWELVEE